MDRTGAELRAAREAANLTQEAVALGVGVSRQTIVTWEQRAMVPQAKADEYLRVVRELASALRQRIGE